MRVTSRHHAHAAALAARGPHAPTAGWPASRWAALFATVVVAWLLTCAPAHAADPFYLPDELVDEVGAVEDEAAVRDAQDRLHAESGLQLYVVYVDDFGGLSGWDWVDETAATSHLGDEDLLVAVATQERSWGMSVSEASGISESQEDRVAGLIEDELRDNDWDGAAVAAADGFLEASQEEGNGGRLALWAGLGIAGLGAVTVGGPRVKRRLDDRRRRQEESEQLAGISEQAGGQLVALDNALAASETELQYAEAEFAPELTRPFREAVEQSRAESVAAYRARQEIGELSETTSYEPTLKRFRDLQTLIEQADTRLEEHTEGFNDLRRLADRAPERIAELTDGLAAAARALDDTEAMLSVRTDLRAGQREQFGDVIAGCRAFLEQGMASVELARERLSAEGPQEAVQPIKAAEQALSEVTAQQQRLADIDGLVTSWADLLSEAATSLTSDVTDAERLAPQDAAVGALAGTARTALGRVGDPAEDPVDLAEELGEVERALDAALASYRAAEEEHLRVVGRAKRQRSRAEARLRFMESDLQSVWALTPERLRRGAQGARDLLSKGVALLDSDPAAAEATLLQAAQQADAVARDLPSVRMQDSSGNTWGWGSSGSSRSSFSSSRSSSRSRSRSRSSSRRSRSSSRRSSSRRSRGGRF